MTNAADTPKDTCVVKVDKSSYRMRECGEPCEYLTRDQDGVTYTGWYHVDRALVQDHLAVPSRIIR